VILREVVGNHGEGDEPRGCRSGGSGEQPEDTGQSAMQPRRPRSWSVCSIGRLRGGSLISALDRVAHAPPHPEQHQQRNRSRNDQHGQQGGLGWATDGLANPLPQDQNAGYRQPGAGEERSNGQGRNADRGEGIAGEGERPVAPAAVRP
jgi:hypothetical protein